MTARPAASFDSRGLRDALGRFATGVVIVTARPTGGGPVGMTMNSFGSVSLNPPLVLFSVDRRAYSLPAMRAAEVFAVNVLGREQEDLADRFARPRVDKWAGISSRPGPRGAPLLDGALAWIACEPHATYDGGDHVIFLGRVVDFGMEEGEERTPLVFFRGRYCGLERGERRPAAWPLSIHY